MSDVELDAALVQQARALGLSDGTINEIIGIRGMKTKHWSWKSRSRYGFQADEREKRW